MSGHIEFAPLENGLDYMESAVQLLQGSPSGRDLKYGVLHLAAGIEVLLKMRLAKEHWSLIFEDVKSATLAKYKNGDFRSVGALEALNRLKNIASISVDEDDATRVRAIVDKRNMLQHFGLLDSVAAIQSVTARALDFLISFLSEHIRDDDPAPADAVEETLNRIRGGLAEIESLVEERMKSQSLALSKQEFVVSCPICQRAALVVNDTCRCLFCLYEGTSEDSADQYVSRVLGLSEYSVVKDGGVWPIFDCPVCSRVSLVEGITDAVTYEAGEAEGSRVPVYWVCFAGCAGWAYGELDTCARCGRFTVESDDEGMGICSDCIEYFVSKDD